MFKPAVARQLARATRVRAPRVALTARTPAIASMRSFSHTPNVSQKEPPKDKHDAASTSGQPGESGDHEGQYARTEKDIRVEYPEEKDLPPSRPIQGRGGFHFKRTLAAFSLEGRVAVVTGGARGLGLVMAQALVTSGADVALVDMNTEEAEKSAQELMDTYKDENPGAEEYEQHVMTSCNVLTMAAGLPRLRPTFVMFLVPNP